MTTLLSVFLFLISVLLLLSRRRRALKNLPPGSLGIPFIGQSLSLLRAMRNNTAEQWLNERIKKYGPISKLTLFGKPAVFLHGHAANKFIFTSNDSVIGNTQVKSLQMILGERSILELSGEDHRRVRSTLMMFLRPESLKQNVGKMEEEIRMHIETHWQSKQQVTVLPLMKSLTFNIMSYVIFGIGKGAKRDKLVNCFKQITEGVWSVPINLPFTPFSRSLKATKLIRKMVRQLIHEKREELEKKSDSSQLDLITCMLRIRGEDNGQLMTEEEIVHNVVTTMIAGYETSSTLITFMMRILANEPSVYSAVLQEQEEIAKDKSPGEFMTWEDLNKMKYTWRVALETLRVISPVLGGFRTALKDIEYNGYIIPKGWKIFWAAPMTHLDSKLYPEATKFDPDRFENSSAPPFSFVGFGGGPRSCPGNEFARIETLITIHYLITRFSWKLCGDLSFSRDPMPEPAQGLPIQITQKRPL